jgi:hypothetical protein
MPETGIRPFGYVGEFYRVTRTSSPAIETRFFSAIWICHSQWRANVRQRAGGIARQRKDGALLSGLVLLNSGFDFGGVSFGILPGIG